MTDTATDVVEAFIDLRSPYSYLALGPARELAQRTGLHIEWWPYLTDFRSAYGGEVEQRSGRDVAKLKYLVIIDPLATDTSEFWKNYGEHNDVKSEDIQTVVFRFPSTCTFAMRRSPKPMSRPNP